MGRSSALRRPAVALLIETSNSYARGLLEGIIAFVRAHDPWSIWLPEQRRGESPPAWLGRWDGDGIIARIETEAIGRTLQRARLPVVDVSAARPLATVPWVETDDVAIARLAVEHLQERGFRRLAFVGEPPFNWSRWRGEHFVRIAQERGLECRTYEPSRSAAGQAVQRRRLGEWLQTLEKPVGLFACYDIKAQQILDLCRELAIAVPEQMAVIGVDNDPLLCNLCTPPLTSVAPDAVRTGYVAAELLDRMLSGEAVPPQPHFIAPLGVETRQSTDILAIEDTDVARALQFIRERARDGINVQDVLKQVPISRRILERKFVEFVGRTPHEEIERVRLDRVCRLLRETELPIAEIAHRTGYEHAEYLTVTFKRSFGMPPSEYRANGQSPR
jgi:LacI family transcriptional regulator